MDLERVEALMKLMQQYDMTEVRLESESELIKLCRGAPFAAAPAVALAAPVVHEPARAAAPAPAPSGHQVNSPMVGTFYRASKPGSPPFVEVGDRVRRGQVLCIIEAMKLMNEIECEVEGTVLDVLVENAQPVQFGQPLFRIAPG